MDHDIGKLHRDFWERFERRVEQRPDTPHYADPEVDTHQNYYPQMDNLVPAVNYTLVTNTVHGYLQVKLHLKGNSKDERFRYLKEHREAIESEIQERGRSGTASHFEWSRGDAFNTVILQCEGNTKTERDRWDEYLYWLIENGEAFDEVFRPYLQSP